MCAKLVSSLDNISLKIKGLLQFSELNYVYIYILISIYTDYDNVNICSLFFYKGDPNVVNIFSDYIDIAYSTRLTPEYPFHVYGITDTFKTHCKCIGLSYILSAILDNIFMLFIITGHDFCHHYACKSTGALWC